MLPDIKLKYIKIYSKLKQEEVFVRHFKSINILAYGNKKGKSTLYHIIKDLFGLNVIGDAKGSSIFTPDLLKENLEVILSFNIGDETFYTKKTYLNKKAKQYFFKDDSFEKILVVGFDNFLEYLSNENLLNLPRVTINNTEKLSFGSLMRLNFVSDTDYTNPQMNIKNEYKTNIIKHVKDGYSKILFYAYVLGIISDIKNLNDAYKIVEEYSDKIKTLKRINDTIKSISTDKVDIDNDTLFDNTQLIKDAQKIEGLLKKKKIENYNYMHLISNIRNLVEENEIIDTYEKIILPFKSLLQNDLKYLGEKIQFNNRIIEKLEEELKTKNNDIRKFDSFYEEHILWVLSNIEDVDSKNFLQKLIQENERVKNEKDFYEEEFKSLKEKIYKDDIVIFFKKLNHYLVDYLGINFDFDFEEGKFLLPTTADSYRRIILMNILVSFIFFKKLANINHFGFVYLDSILIGIEPELKIKAINMLINKYINEKITRQIFLNINSNNVDVSKIESYDNISIKNDNSGKMLFDI